MVRSHKIPPVSPISAKRRVDGLYAAIQRVLAASLAAVVFASATAAFGGETAWIDERLGYSWTTGEWSQLVAYNRTTGLAKFDEGEYVFTPFAPSEGKYVTIEARATFSVNEDVGALESGAQAAVRIATNSSFQVWSKTGWLDVAADGITPVAGREYGVRLMFNYDEGVYSVAVKAISKSGESDWQLLMTAARGAIFPLAAKTDKVSSITFDGNTTFRSLKGSCHSIGSNQGSWNKSNSPQTPTGAVEANRTIRRFQPEQLGRIERSAGPNWSG